MNRQNRTLAFAIALMVMAALAVAALAAEEGKNVTLTGKIVCAKCSLKKADAKQCQDVLVVAGEKDGGAAEYYLVKNEAAEKFGHSCSGEKPAVVTGTVSTKDGKKWITASRIEAGKG
jgi:hypothetical protein